MLEKDDFKQYCNEVGNNDCGKKVIYQLAWLFFIIFFQGFMHVSILII